MKKIAALLAIAGFAIAGQASATVNLVVNGSFENAPGLGLNSWTVYAGSSLPGWTSTSGAGIEVQSGVAGQAADGHNLVELDSHNNSNMWQDIATVVGATYEWSFEYSARPNQPSKTTGISYYFGNNRAVNLAQKGKSDTNWLEVNGTFVADSAFTRVYFEATGDNDSLGGYIDNVVVTGPQVAAVPEPETYAMLGLGLLAVGIARRRKAV